jgi:transposase-like protein
MVCLNKQSITRGQALAMNSADTCPQCGSMNYKRNGRIHTGKQNHRCRDGGRQFVLSAENRLISDAERALLKRLLSERLSLRGMAFILRKKNS